MQGKVFEGIADTLYIPLAARVYVSKRFPEYSSIPSRSNLKPPSLATASRRAPTNTR